MSEPRSRRSSHKNREFGSSFNFYEKVTINGLVVQGISDGDLFGYSAATPAAHSPGSGNSSSEDIHVRDNRPPPGDTGRSTHNTPASRAENHQSRTSFDNPILQPSSVLDRRSDHGSQSSVRSTTRSERLSLLDVNCMENSSTASELAEGSTTLVNTPTEDDLHPISVMELAIPPIIQKLGRDPKDHAIDISISDSDADSNDNSSRWSFRSAECGGCGDCGECRGSASASITATPIRRIEDPTNGEVAIMIPPKTDHDAERPKGFIDRVEQFFRSLPNRVKGSSLGRFLNLGRQVAPPI